ncbi:hypothetical protein NSDW_21510 [Novosphingobium olei]|nr:hypothetical protein NSDW_21510 [Novosphingobium olei]
MKLPDWTTAEWLVALLIAGLIAIVAVLGLVVLLAIV